MPNDDPPGAPPDEAPLPDLWALLDQAREGSMAAFGELYERTRNEVRGYLLGKTRSADLADDLTSQTYLNMLGHIGAVTRAAGSPVAYLLKVAANLATSHYRRSETRLTVPMADIGDALALARASREQAREPSVTPVRVEALVLQAGIDRLPTDQRAVLVMRFQLGRSAADTAAALGRSEAWVRTVQCRAVRALASDEQVRALAVN